MRIISKFGDYYDSSMAYGQDKSVVFVRNEEVLVERSHQNDIPAEYAFMKPSMGVKVIRDTKTRKEYRLTPFMIAFCGRLYSGIRVEKATYSYDGTDFDQCFYALEDYKAAIEKLGFKLSTKKRPSSQGTSALNEDNVKDYLAQSGSTHHLNALAERREPILYCANSSRWSDEYRLLKNCELKKRQFYRVFDAFQAFQELDMFISGIMAQDGNPMANIHDCDLAKQKGFDCYSFKKGPTKRQAKSCR